jgi:transposase
MLDNVRFYHNKKTLKLITDINNNYIFTPPYSPINNPIEVIFSIIKNKFKKIKKDKLKIKPLIIISINKTIENEKNKSYKEIFKISINYEYKDIEKELRDRLIIKK